MDYHVEPEAAQSVGLIHLLLFRRVTFNLLQCITHALWHPIALRLSIEDAGKLYLVLIIILCFGRREAREVMANA
jgi:hypothetical protein